MTFLYTKASPFLKHNKPCYIPSMFSFVPLPTFAHTFFSLAALPFSSMNQKERSMPYDVYAAKQKINGVAGNRTQNLLHSVMLEEQC
jgi:hypothetical protein